MEKAKVLGELITESVKMGATDNLPKLLEELAAVDKEDSLGFQYKYGVPQKVQAIQKQLQNIYMQLRELNKTLSGLTDKEQQKAVQADLDASLKALEEVKKKWEVQHGKLHDH